VLIVLELRKGMSGARSDDTKSLKGPILDWIVPHGQTLLPPLARNIKTDRGFHHERTGSLLCPAGMDWSDTEYIIDLHVRNFLILIQNVGSRQSFETVIWLSLAINGQCFYMPMRRMILKIRGKGYLEVPFSSLWVCYPILKPLLTCSDHKAYKHVFTSPSSVDNVAKATRSGNARIHGMTCVTPASIAYIATQVCISLLNVHFYVTDPSLGTICPHLLVCVLQNWRGHRLGRLL
jgi:hypothetical protein